MTKKESIVEYLDKQIHDRMEFECMPENEDGYYYVSKDSISKIVDGLIPLVKSKFKQLKKEPEWVKINSEDDLPKEIQPCWFVTRDCEDIAMCDIFDGIFTGKYFQGRRYQNDIWQSFTVDMVSHYMPIVKPQPPIY